MSFNEFPITILLIALNALVSLGGFTDRRFLSKTIMWPYGVKRNNEYYRFISSGFLHANLIHLFFNMFTLFFFGRNIEILFSLAGLGGSISYLILYFSALVISDLPSYRKHQDNPNYHSLGASGAVSAILFASILFSPWESIYLYGFLKVSALLFAVLYVYYCIYMAKKGADNVNHDAHLWGAIYGLGFTIVLVAFMKPKLFYLIWEQLFEASAIVVQ